MNWLDIIILIIVGFGVLMGWRVGLFGAIFNTAGAILGVLLAARLSDNVANLLTDSVSSDTLATVIAYVLILIAVFVAAQIARGIVKRILRLVFLGWVDDLGGLALGLADGVIIAGALITVLARYSADLPAGGVAGTVVESLRVRGGIDDALTGSELVGVFLDIRDAVPAHALGFVPDEFKVALDLLEERIEAEAGATPS